MKLLHRFKVKGRTHAVQISRIARKHGLSPKLYHGGLSHYVAVYIPSTTDEIRKIKTPEFRKRTREAERFLSGKFGGETTYPASGGWFGGRKFIKERINVVRSYATLGAMQKYGIDVRRFVREEKKKWGQKALTVESDGHMFFR